jgi:Flp pilus assembly protein TadD
MKRIYLLCLLPLLAACDDAQTQGWLGNKGHREALDQLPGPEVESVNGTLERQAREAMESGDVQRGAQFYDQLLGSKKLTPAEKLHYKIGFAEAMRRMGDNDKALTAFDEILKEAPDNLDAQENRGLTLMALGKSTDAGRAFSDIMKKDAKRWRTLNALGILFVTKNMVPEAMAYFTEALAQSPDNPSILNNVGLAQAVDKNFPRAIAALEQASRVAGSNGRRRQVDLNLALVYASSGDVDTAKEIAGKYLQGPALDNNLGLYAHLAKDDALAKTYLNMALSGSEVFYQRAWNNLDIVDKNGVAQPAGNGKSKR